jgi:hypothetical protein
LFPEREESRADGAFRDGLALLRGGHARRCRLTIEDVVRPPHRRDASPSTAYAVWIRARADAVGPCPTETALTTGGVRGHLGPFCSQSSGVRRAPAGTPGAVQNSPNSSGRAFVRPSGGVQECDGQSTAGSTSLPPAGLSECSGPQGPTLGAVAKRRRTLRKSVRGTRASQRAGRRCFVPQSKRAPAKLVLNCLDTMHVR